MRISLLLLFTTLLTTGSPAQLQGFVQQARAELSHSDSVYFFEGHPFQSGEINVLRDSTEVIESLLKYQLLEKYNPKHDTLKQSHVLTQLSCISLNRLNGITAAKKETMYTIKRKLFRVFRASRSSFGLISVYSFEVSLVQVNGDYYYDKNGPDDGFNLYKGKRKPRPTKEDPEPEITALPAVTEAEMFEQLSVQLRKSGCTKELQSGLCSYAGFAVIPDKRTFYRHKIPTAKVVILLGTKRLRKISV